jgi:16S rRNA (guanine966-N2)-methyltransferase
VLSCEIDAQALEIARKYLAAAPEDSGARLVELREARASEVLAAARAEGATFDLVFIDPPYEISNEEIEENLTALLPRLNAEAIVIVERSSRSEAFAVVEGYTLEDSKNYGDTEVFWLNKI